MLNFNNLQECCLNYNLFETDFSLRIKKSFILNCSARFESKERDDNLICLIMQSIYHFILQLKNFQLIVDECRS